MKKLHQVALGIAMLALANIASAQASASASAQGSKDPFVEARDQKASAKAEYKAKKISKAEYKQEKKKARAKLKETGVRSDTEKNQEVQTLGK